ncbi:MAG: glycosyltransferase family 2 protein [Desulfovibrio sp.]|jgi:glycosyltransferase involved in cell wall biosynthesis|nr:glycosyltransferase family 2 protein [Desulfovibrio sp.]
MQTAQRSNTPPVLAIILPCYNEESVLPSTIGTIVALLEKMADDGHVSTESFALFVDDGSLDATWAVIAEHHRRDARVHGLKFAGNAGHQNALLAGMATAERQADCAITVDADLQDDISVIPEMLRQLHAGSHIVYGVRRDRTADTLFKRTTANMFYTCMHLLGAPVIPGHADFRLVSRFAMRAIGGYPESNLFLRSIFPGMKMRSSRVYYARKARTAGETKYPLRRMLSLAFHGITDGSPAPLRLAAILSIVTLFFAMLQTGASLFAYFSGNTIPGWTSLMLITLYLGSVQLFCIALLGEYLARVFTEVKRRPRYVIEKELQ